MSARSLLDSTSTIRKQTEKYSRLTGGDFNVFEILRLRAHENSHSLFIAELLNPSGSHGQGPVFWNAFVDCVKDLAPHCDNDNSRKLGSHLLPMAPECLRIKTEHHLGEKAETEGGRVDIAVFCEDKELYFENKIYAYLQDRQLERYLITGKPVLFLTLSAQYSDEESLPKDSNLYRINYEEHICAWVKRCIELSASKPALRESLLQYQAVIQWLTNQGTNQVMNEELKAIICKDKDSVRAFFALADCRSNILRSVGDQLVKVCLAVANSEECQLNLVEKSFDECAKAEGFSFRKNDWRNIQIGVEFHKGFKDFLYGICLIEGDRDVADNHLANAIRKEFIKEFDHSEPQTSWWPASRYFSGHWQHWGDEAFAFADLLLCRPESGDLGDFGVLLKNKVVRMKQVIEKAMSEFK